MKDVIKNLLPDEKARAAGLSVISNTILVLMKLAAGIMIGSVSVISEAIHSGLDLVAAVIAFISVRLSYQPPDEKHPFGHGKIENLSGTIEALLIFIAAIWIIIEAVGKIIKGSYIESPLLGIAVMGIAAGINWLISNYLMRVAKKTDSIALEADALHLKTDVYTSLGVFLGLVLLQFTGVQILDPIIAIAVALVIIKASYDLTLKALSPLLDTALPVDEEKVIIEILEKCIDEKKIIEYHDLRTRKAGSERHIDLHVLIAGNCSVSFAHKICDEIEELIKNRLSKTSVVIHVEPWDKEEEAVLEKM